jgi:hypothetical protein
VTEIPYGDPGAMRAFAFEIRNAADRLGGLAASTYSHAFSFEWDGFAALRFRGNVGELTSGARSVAGRLQALSDYLVQQAGLLESEQDEARRRIEAEQLLAAAHQHNGGP